ncbi:MAG: hypothetical protein WC618_03970, partial [Patescibacteria group bacterium]
MPKHPKQFIFVAAMVSFALFGGQYAQAREGYFQPASGEVIAASPGQEKATANEEGGVSLFASDGTLVGGYPLFVANQVAASSPVIADVTGDTAGEIAFISRDSAGARYLRVYDGQKNELASVSLGNSDIFCDPVAFALNSGKKGIVIATDSGLVSVYEYQAGVLDEVKIVELEESEPVCAAPSYQANELIINYPTFNKIDVKVYNRGDWTLGRQLTISSPIIYGMTAA